MSAPTLDIHESGDAALRAVAVSSDTEANWSTVHSLAAWLATAGVDGIHGAVPTYDSVLVEFDPYITSARQVRAFIQLGMRQLEFVGGALRQPRHFDVPVVYGGGYGPDLERVAEQQGLSTADVIALHTEKSYLIRCLGAPAGSPMMDGPDFPILSRGSRTRGCPSRPAPCRWPAARRLSPRPWHRAAGASSARPRWLSSTPPGSPWFPIPPVMSCASTGLTPSNSPGLRAGRWRPRHEQPIDRRTGRQLGRHRPRAGPGDPPSGCPSTAPWTSSRPRPPTSWQATRTTVRSWKSPHWTSGCGPHRTCSSP